MFGEKPHSLYSLAYDAVALAASLSKKGNENLNSAITAPEGYIGINGVFRLFANGTNEHSLDIVEITENGDKSRPVRLLVNLIRLRNTVSAATAFTSRRTIKLRKYSVRIAKRRK